MPQPEDWVLSQDDKETRMEPYAAPELAKAFEQSQIGKYHTKGGTGFAAEDANIFSDRIRLKRVAVTGTSNAANDADRVADGMPIQTKKRASRLPVDARRSRYRHPKSSHPIFISSSRTA